MDARLPASARTAAVVDEALAFMQVLWKLEHALERVSKRMEDNLGVSGPQRLALRIIGSVPDIGPAELATALHLHPSTITGVVQRLEARRLIRRIQHANDGRRVHLRVTRAGARLNVPHAPGTVEAAVRRTLSKTRIEDRDATVKVLERLAANLVGTV